MLEGKERFLLSLARQDKEITVSRLGAEKALEDGWLDFFDHESTLIDTK
jgi:hypothetical protein